MTGITRIVALAATLVLVLQSALAMAAPPVQRDIFGNVICAGGAGSFMPERGGGAKHAPDCCMLSCNMAAQVADGLPPAAHIPAIAGGAQAIGSPMPATIYPPERHTPANPRAPPSVA